MLLGAPGLTTRSRNATRSKDPLLKVASGAASSTHMRRSPASFLPASSSGPSGFSEGSDRSDATDGCCVTGSALPR